jgi:extracellular factor (EF) 3-hydroxypalmitic acid methyl ester biosynthesis protein
MKTMSAVHQLEAEVFRRLDEGLSVPVAMESLFIGLRQIKRTSDRETWKMVVSDCHDHPLRLLLHQDPCSSRAYCKPRGYAGDAVMMDYIYNWPNLTHADRDVTPLGTEIYGYTGDTPSSRAVRARRDVIAERLDEVAETIESPHILSVACGHLREAHLSRAVEAGRFARYIALDQDRESLDVVDSELKDSGIETMRESVTGILKERDELRGFDFIYSSGLYDYLSEPVARRLTELLFAKLNPGGRLLIANFQKDIKDLGYMETYLSWFLIYRNESELISLLVSIPDREIRYQRTFVEENENIAFMELIR